MPSQRSKPRSSKRSSKRRIRAGLLPENCIGEQDPITFDTITPENVFEFASSNGVKQCFTVDSLHQLYKHKYYYDFNNLRNPITNQKLFPMDSMRLQDEFLRRNLDVNVTLGKNQILKTTYGYKVNVSNKSTDVLLDIFLNTTPKSLILTYQNKQTYFERREDILTSWDILRDGTNGKLWIMYSWNPQTMKKEYRTKFNGTFAFWSLQLVTHLSPYNFFNQCRLDIDARGSYERVTLLDFEDCKSYRNFFQRLHTILYGDNLVKADLQID